MSVSRRMTLAAIRTTGREGGARGGIGWPVRVRVCSRTGGAKWRGSYTALVIAAVRSSAWKLYSLCLSLADYLPQNSAELVQPVRLWNHPFEAVISIFGHDRIVGIAAGDNYLCLWIEIEQPLDCFLAAHACRHREVDNDGSEWLAFFHGPPIGRNRLAPILDGFDLMAKKPKHRLGTPAKNTLFDHPTKFFIEFNLVMQRVSQSSFQQERKI
jgi:hypothetical protein